MVAANASALPLLVYEGENGHLFEPGDVDTLASRLTEVLSEEGKRAQMGEESLRIAARHDIEETLSAFEELYDLVLSSRRAGAIRANISTPSRSLERVRPKQAQE